MVFPTRERRVLREYARSKQKEVKDENREGGTRDAQKHVDSKQRITEGKSPNLGVSYTEMRENLTGTFWRRVKGGLCV